MKFKLLFFALISLSIFALSFKKNEAVNNADCKWGSPSLKNCELTDWREASYTIYPICPKCSEKKASGQTGGMRPVYNVNDKETIKTNSVCWNKSCIPQGRVSYEFEYGFTVTAICK